MVRSRDPRDESWEASRQGTWERWERNWMGLRDSPYRSIQWQIRLKLEVCGDQRVLANPFHWDRVELNLPSSKGYRSDLPWVMKIRCNSHLATEVYVYMDNMERVAQGWGFRTHQESAQRQLTPQVLGRAPSHTQMRVK